MKTVASLADLKSLALAVGAEVVLPHGRFNSERVTAAVSPPRPAPAAPVVVAAPVAPVAAPLGVGREEVGALLSVHSDALMARLNTALVHIERIEAECEALRRRTWRIEIKYDKDGAITSVEQKPAKDSP